MTRVSKPPRSYAFAYVLRVTVAVAIAAMFRTRVVGAENVPRTGGVLLAGNHISYGDPVLLWCRSPRPVHFMAKAELWKVSLVGWFLDQTWTFPIKRGESDRGALTRASKYLKAGEVVGLFPEGTRNIDGVAEAQGGAAFLSLHNGIPVIPVGISGTERIRPKGTKGIRFPKVVISFGAPIDPSELAAVGKKERVETMTAEIMRRIGEQVAHAREVAGS